MKKVYDSDTAGGVHRLIGYHFVFLISLQDVVFSHDSLKTSSFDQHLSSNVQRTSQL